MTWAGPGAPVASRPRCSAPQRTYAHARHAPLRSTGCPGPGRGDRNAREGAFLDENAEIRVQAAVSFESFPSKTEAVSPIVQQALSADASGVQREYLLDALRRRYRC